MRGVVREKQIPTVAEGFDVSQAAFQSLTTSDSTEQPSLNLGHVQLETDHYTRLNQMLVDSVAPRTV
jgi:hypothetical protein